MVNVELVYTGSSVLTSVDGVYDVLSDEAQGDRHVCVLALDPKADTNAALSKVLEAGVLVNSFKELVPRMNDIFIKLVTEEK